MTWVDPSTTDQPFSFQPQPAGWAGAVTRDAQLGRTKPRSINTANPVSPTELLMNYGNATVAFVTGAATLVFAPAFPGGALFGLICPLDVLGFGSNPVAIVGGRSGGLSAGSWQIEAQLSASPFGPYTGSMNVAWMVIGY